MGHVRPRYPAQPAHDAGLWRAHIIEAGEYPEWELGLQIFTEAQADAFSFDMLLAGRIHSYLDTQITRLGGANFHEIPLNAPPGYPPGTGCV